MCGIPGASYLTGLHILITSKSSTANQVVGNIDIAPTLLSLADLEIPKNYQGRSLLPLLKDQKAEWADRVLFTHVGRWPRGANPEDHKSPSAPSNSVSAAKPFADKP